MSYWMRPFLGRLGYPRCSPASTSPKPRWAQPPPGGPALGLDLLRLCPPSSSRLPEPGGRGWGSKFKPQASAWELRALLISQPLSLNCTGSATGRIQDTGPRPPSPMQVPVVRGLRESNCTRNLSPGPPLPVVEGGQGDCSQTRRSSWDGKGRERPTCLNTVALGSEHPGGADDPTCQLPGMMALVSVPTMSAPGPVSPGWASAAPALQETLQDQQGSSSGGCPPWSPELRASPPPSRAEGPPSLALQRQQQPLPQPSDSRDSTHSDHSKSSSSSSNNNDTQPHESGHPFSFLLTQTLSPTSRAGCRDAPSLLLKTPSCLVKHSCSKAHDQPINKDLGGNRRRCCLCS